MNLLTKTFAIDICAYAIMSNHYHVVLHIDLVSASNWSKREVIERWKKLFSVPAVVERYLNHQASTAECLVVSDLIVEWRKRLHDISWFMRCLNEPIARQANKEDSCTGRFWEGRYKSQALLDKKALTACIAYVELNPVKAGMAKTPKDSEYCSISERIDQIDHVHNSDKEGNTPNLLPFIGNTQQDTHKGIPLQLHDYIQLVEWTGRAILEKKQGYVDNKLPPILDRLQINSKHWLCLAQNLEGIFKGLVGSSYKLRNAYQRLGYRRTPNLSIALQYFT
jgi:REP element-mobilizing transposase RayT